MSVPKAASQSSRATFIKTAGLLLALFFILHQLTRLRFDTALVSQLEEPADDPPRQSAPLPPSDAAKQLPDEPAVPEKPPSAPKKPPPQPAQIQTPPPLASAVKNVPNRPSGELPETPSFTRPRALTVLGFRHPDVVETTLHVFTSGINTGIFKRNFQVRGCLVGNDAYAVHIIHQTIVTCIVPRPIETGEKISVLLKVDDELLNAMKGPVVLNKTLFEIREGDVDIVGTEGFNRDASLQGKELALVRSDVKWHPQLLEPHMDIDQENIAEKTTGPRYGLCLMTAMKEETYVLRDWAMHHHRLGVDRVYIYDNEAPNDIAELLKDLPYVEVVYWPFKRSQIQSDSHFMYSMRSRCEYAAFFDGDEYALIGDMKAGSLKKYVHLRVAEGFNHIQLDWVVMMNNGYVEQPKGRLPDLYTRKAKEEPKREGKVVVNCDMEWQQHKIHSLTLDNGKREWFTDHDSDDFPAKLSDPARLIHYRYRSWEEYVHKVNQGRGGILGLGPLQELKIDEPAKNYMDMNRSVEYTYFKEKYNKLMSGEDTHKTEIVRWDKGTKCVSLDGGPEVCE